MSVDVPLLAYGGMACAVGFACPFLLLGWRGKSGVPRRVAARPSFDALLMRMPVLATFCSARRRRERNAKCLAQMPSLLDIVTLGLSAGLSFDASLELYCSRSSDELSVAVGKTMLLWQTGLSSRADALVGLADDLGSPSFRRFADAVLEALAFGSPLASTLARQAQAIRDERRSLVEEQIEKVPVKMLVPLGTLIVPAMLLAILGPLLGSAVGTF